MQIALVPYPTFTVLDVAGSPSKAPDEIVELVRAELQETIDAA